jgi:hypothetical protein
MAELPVFSDEIVLTHFIVSGYIAPANSWVIVNVGGGPNGRQAGPHARDTAPPGPGKPAQRGAHPANRHFTVLRIVGGGDL